MILPDVIPTLLNKGFDKTISLMLQEPDNHFQNMIRLSKICKVKVTFSCPVTIYINRRHTVKDVTEYVFSGFFLSGNTLCYMIKSDARRGFYMPQASIVSYEPVLKTLDAFENFEQFRKKFDTQFITEDLIQKLWNDTSAQHGERYKPSDFKSISAAGKEALKMFLRQFKGVNDTDKSMYSERTSFDGSKYYNITGVSYGTGESKTSRDIHVSHTFGRDRVYYSSEYAGTGNGTYGLIANKSTYLWLEND